jgi:hypothetical protein
LSDNGAGGEACRFQSRRRLEKLRFMILILFCESDRT